MDILNGEKATQHSPTEQLTTKKFTRNEATIHITDTPGLTGTNKDSEKLRKCSEYTESKADLLLYCLPVGPGHKFHDTNPEIMKSLTESFGKGIWDHCVLVLTMSNRALLRFKEVYKNRETAAKEYKKSLKEYSATFAKHLHNLKAEKHVKTVFELKTTDNITNLIIAVPAGYDESSRVLPGLEYSLFDHCEKNWISILIEIMRNKCSRHALPILQYQEEHAHSRGIAETALIVGGALFAAGVAAYVYLTGKRKRKPEEMEEKLEPPCKRQKK